MCGRFSLSIPDFAELASLVGVTYDPRLAAHYRPRYNVPPSDQHWIVAETDQRTILPARWGYGPKKLPLVRGEMAARQFKHAFEGRRCVVPVDGFFEWTGEKGKKKPHWFHPPHKGELMLLGGLYTEGPEGFEFSILTTEANAVVKPVHHRMPVVIDKAAVDRWLHGAADDAQKLIAPAPPANMIDTEVSTRVNAAVNDDAACLEAAPPEEPHKQGKLF